MRFPKPEIGAQAVAEIEKKLEGLLQPWNRNDAPGLVIGVALGGVPVFRRGFGLASVEHGTSNTPKTRMRIGSTSKHFTSLAALLLAEEGKLDIDAPVRTYLPELDGVSGDPTLRQMMQHTSGLRDPYDLPGILLYGTWSMIMYAGAGLEITRRFTDTNYPRGERMVYSNQGYHLLSLVIERVSGMPLASFLKQRILEPLGMADTELVNSDMRMVSGIASLHVPQPDGGYRRGIYPGEELLGAGGIVSTIDDMLKWLSHLRSDKKDVGTPASWEEMLQQTRYSSGAAGDYGLGLIRETYRGVEIIHHSGGVMGGTCQMLTVPAEQLDIILMFNRMDGPAPGTAAKVIDTLLEGKLEPVAPPLKSSGHESFLGRWYSAASHRLAGVVELPLPGQEPALALSIQNQVSGLLEESGGDLSVNTPTYGTVGLHMPAAEKDGAATLEITHSGHVERYVRLPDSAPQVSELAPEILGSYRYADLDLELSVILDQDVLYLDLHPKCGTTRFRLTPYTPDVYGCMLVSSWPIPLPPHALGSAMMVERSGGKVTGLLLNSSRTANLWLERCT